MTKLKDINFKDTLKRSESFMEKMNSAMEYKSKLIGDEMTFEWVEEIDIAIPYLDNIVRNPKVALIKEEDIVILEKARKTSVETVKHLAKNTRNIETVDPETGEVTPSKLLIERNEETFNIYENRFVYTLINTMLKFVMKMEDLLDDMKLQDDKLMEYAATTIAGQEKINVEFRISANDLSKNNESLEKEIEEARKKINIFKQFIANWRKSEMIAALEKAHVPEVMPPIKKTNVILKNPNFQVAVKLWDYLQRFIEAEEDEKENPDERGDNPLLGILNDAFLMNYYVMDMKSYPKKEQKEKLAEYAVVMIHEQIKRVISLLLDSGVKMSDEEILSLILNEIRKQKEKKAVDSADVKNKFRSEFEEYLNQARNIGG